MKVVKIDMTTFRGWSIGAEHWYGKLSYRLPFKGSWSSTDPTNFKPIELKRQMGEEEAKMLSEKDGYEWLAGEETTRFDTPEQLDAAGLLVFNELFDPNEDILIRVFNDSVHWKDDRFRKVVGGKPSIVAQFEGLELEEAAKVAEQIGLDYLVLMS